jgi:hypothetical protein
MKKITYPLLIVALFTAVICQAQPLSPPRPLLPPGAPPGQAEPAKEPVNYLVRIEWSEPKEDAKYLELQTAEGQFQLDTIQKNSVKINNAEIPVTLKVTGNIHEVSAEKARLQLFLGRTVPYVTSTYASGPGSTSSSYSQMSVGLDSGYYVEFGKPLVIQSDENGKITVTVKRNDK